MQQSSPGVALLLVVALVVVSRLVRRGRRQSRLADLAPGERIRPLAITLIDPLISVLIIGQLVGQLVSHSATNLLAAVVGSIVGVVVGHVRARIMFVRALKRTRSIVLRRSGLEYGLVAALIILRSLEGSVERSSSRLATSLVAGLATLALVEAIARSGFIVKRYVDSPDDRARGFDAADPPRQSIDDPEPE